MEDRARFLELLQEVLEIAKTEEREMSHEEIRKYFSEMDLSDEQMSYISEYIREGRIPKDEADEESGAENLANEETSPKRVADSRYLRMYKQELKLLKELSEEERSPLYREYLNGTNTHKNDLIEANLKRVMRIARKYKDRGIIIEELIQEGNLALMQAMETMLQEKEHLNLESDAMLVRKCEDYLEQEITNALILIVDDEELTTDHENALVAKTALIHEATKTLAEELGRVATVQELSDYTKLSKEEIEDIKGVSHDAVHLGK